LAKGSKATCKANIPKGSFKKLTEAIKNICGKNGNGDLRKLSLLTFLKMEGDINLSIDKDLYEELK